MEPNLNEDRQQAHALLDLLPAEKLNAVRSLLEVLVEPLERSLALAPVEEEALTSETAAALERARASLARGEGIPHERSYARLDRGRERGGGAGTDRNPLISRSPHRFARHRTRDGVADSALRRPLPGQPQRGREETQTAADRIPAAVRRLPRVLRSEGRQRHRDHRRAQPPRGVPLSAEFPHWMEPAWRLRPFIRYSGPIPLKVARRLPI